MLSIPVVLLALAIDPAHYTMTVDVHTGQHTLSTKGTIAMPALRQPEEWIEFQLSKLMEMDATFFSSEKRVPGKFERTDTDGNETYWRFTPEKPFATGARLTATFTSSGGNDTATIFSIDEEASFAGEPNTVWYPHVLIEGKNRRSIGEITYNVPAGYVVNSTGVRRSGNNFSISTPSFFSFTAAKYVVTRVAGAIPVELYTLGRRGDADSFASRIRKIIDVLASEFGPFPYAELKIAEVPHEQSAKAGFSGTASNGMMLVSSSVMASDFSTAFYAHELGHIWWGDLVNAGYHSESLAQLGSLIAVGALEGEAAAEEYRRVGYPGYAPFQSAAGYLMLNAAGLDQPLDKLESGTVAHEIADSKGFLVFDMLRRAAGADAFRAAMRRLFSEHRFESVNTRQIFDAFGSKELEWFYEDWFTKTGAPSWRFEPPDAIVQAEPAFRALVPIELCGVTQMIFLRGPRTTFANPCHASSIAIDPHYTVLHWTDEMRADADALVPFWKATAFRWEGKRDAARAAFETSLQSVPETDEHGLAFMLHYGLGRLYLLASDEEHARAEFEAAVAAPVRRARLLPNVYLELGRIADRRGDRAAARIAAASVIAADHAAGGRTGTVNEARTLRDRSHE